MTSPRALILTPSFFGYENAIADAFRAQGVIADVADERPSNTSLARAMIRKSPRLINGITRRHFERLLKSTGRHRYDLILVIKAESVTAHFMAELRRQQPGAMIVFYAYDSVATSSHWLELAPYFDKLYSFDRQDCAHITNLEYKTLFYSSEFSPVADKPERYTVSFVGTLHSGRYGDLEHLRHQVTGFWFFYVQARWYFVLGKYLTRQFRRIPRADVSFVKMTRADVANVFGRSDAVLDIQRRGQTGLTMRTFEALASGSRLVTSNPAIRDEPFFTPERIYVVETDAGWKSPALIDFLEARWEPESRVPTDFHEYSLDRWVAGFLSDAGITDPAAPQEPLTA